MRRRVTAPTLERHKRSGNGYARFNGRQVWFGPMSDPETQRHFAAFVLRWEATGRELPGDPLKDAPFTVADLVARYLERAGVDYRRAGGTQTHEVVDLRYSVRPLLECFSAMPARVFDLRLFKQVRELIVESGLARQAVNIRVGRIARILGR